LLERAQTGLLPTFAAETPPMPDDTE